MRARRPLLALVGLALAGCALKDPPPREELVLQALPNLKLPEKYVEARDAGTVQHGWLAAFNDAQLDALVREALANNPDLQVAASRVEQAAGFVKVAGATLYPQVNALARGGGALSGDSSGLEGAGIFANWELDLWGRVRAGRASARGQYDSTSLDAEYARQSLAALVAKSWFLATEARLQKANAEEMAAASERQLGLANDRLRVGRGDQYDVALARANLATFRDSVQSLDLAYRQSLRALEALAVGTAVVLCDQAGVGPMVTTTELERLRRLNFGIRTLQESVDSDTLEKEIARYDATDAMEVSRRVRRACGSEEALSEIVALYKEVIADYKQRPMPDLEAESRAAAAYLRQLPLLLARERDVLANSATFRLRNRLLRIPFAGSLARSLSNRIAN